MRRKDWDAALAVRDHWNDPDANEAPTCVLFKSLDTFLQGIVRLRIYPGNAISQCPFCGEEHRWSLLKQILIFGIDMRPRGDNRVLDAFYESLSEERELYGGEDGYRKMRQKAEEFFSSHPTGDVYLP